LASAITSLGYVQSISDYSLSVKYVDNHLTILLVYVDAIVLTGDDLKEINAVKKFLLPQILPWNRSCSIGKGHVSQPKKVHF